MDASNELLGETEPSALVTADGIVRRLNTPMATALGRAADQCVGQDLAALLSGDQGVPTRRLLAQGAAGEPRAMAVLVLPGRGTPVACLFKVQSAADAAGDEQLVRLHALSAQNDLAALLIPFQLAAKTAGVALWTYSPARRELEWLGGMPAVAKYSPKHTMSLAWVLEQCHPDDREALRRLMRPPVSPVPSHSAELRFFGEDDDWHYLRVETRRVQLGYGGPTVTFAMAHDDTERRKLADRANETLRRAGNQQLRVELAIELQKSMLPRVTGDLPGVDVDCRYRPCQDGLDIGGDWYGAFVLPDGAVGVHIGDVQGHDPRAAALMGQICAVLRAVAEYEPAPGIVLGRINELLIKTGSARFASCTMLHVDARTGRVTGTTAGHVPILSVHKDGTYDIIDLSGGPVLGVVPGAVYPEEAFELPWDSALVMVTDGVVEGPELPLDAGLRHTGQMAAEALRQGLSSRTIARRVLETAKTLDHLDDAAVLVMRRPSI